MWGTQNKGGSCERHYLNPLYDSREVKEMAGPMSAPNGDRGLIRNDPQERFTFCTICKKVLPARVDDAKHKRLRTGKTELKKK